MEKENKVVEMYKVVDWDSSRGSLFRYALVDAECHGSGQDAVIAYSDNIADLNLVVDRLNRRYNEAIHVKDSWLKLDNSTLRMLEVLVKDLEEQALKSLDSNPLHQMIKTMAEKSDNPAVKQAYNEAMDSVKNAVTKELVVEQIIRRTYTGAVAGGHVKP